MIVSYCPHCNRKATHVMKKSGDDVRCNGCSRHYHLPYAGTRGITREEQAAMSEINGDPDDPGQFDQCLSPKVSAIRQKIADDSYENDLKLSVAIYRLLDDLTE